LGKNEKNGISFFHHDIPLCRRTYLTVLESADHALFKNIFPWLNRYHKSRAEDKKISENNHFDLKKLSQLVGTWSQPTTQTHICCFTDVSNILVRNKILSGTMPGGAVFRKV
jgi:hypothetical protein